MTEATVIVSPLEMVTIVVFSEALSLILSL